MKNQQVSGVAALIAAAGVVTAGMSAGAAGAQATVIDWLAPATGLWSDPVNWAGGNVPDSLDEAARIAPMVPARTDDGIGALVDGSFEVEAVTGNGVVGVVIQNESSLAVGSLIEGTGSDRFVIVVGDDSLTGGGATLETLGTGGSRGGVTLLNNAIIELVNENAELVSGDDTRIGSDAIVTGSGQLIGGFSNSGLIIADNGDTLTITDAAVTNFGTIEAGFGSTVRVTQSSVIRGALSTSGGTIEFDNANVQSSSISGFGVGALVELSASFTSVAIEPGADLRVNGLLSYLATDGVFRNAGDVVIGEFGRISFDDTPESAVLVEGGRVTLEGGQFIAQGGDEVYLFPGATIAGTGRICGDVVNFGRLDATVIDAEEPGSVLEIEGGLTQLSLGTVTAGVVQPVLPSFGEPEAQQLLVNSGDVLLGGELVVNYLVIERDRIAGVPYRVIQHRNPNGAFAFEGEFDSVTLSGVAPGLSPIPQVDYNEADVSVTLFCMADVSRDGVVTGADFSAWIIAYNNRDALADQNLDGAITPADFNAWLLNFNGGCGR